VKKSLEDEEEEENIDRNVDKENLPIRK